MSVGVWAIYLTSLSDSTAKKDRKERTAVLQDYETRAQIPL